MFGLEVFLFGLNCILFGLDVFFLWSALPFVRSGFVFFGLDCLLLGLDLLSLCYGYLLGPDVFFFGLDEFCLVWVCYSWVWITFCLIRMCVFFGLDCLGLDLSSRCSGYLFGMDVFCSGLDYLWYGFIISLAWITFFAWSGWVFVGLDCLFGLDLFSRCFVLDVYSVWTCFFIGMH